MPLLEQRDGYFTKLKAAIEGTHKLHKQKVCHADCCMQTPVISIHGPTHVDVFSFDLKHVACSSCAAADICMPIC